MKLTQTQRAHAHMLFLWLLGVCLFAFFFWTLISSRTVGEVSVDTSATVGNILPEFVGGLVINDDGGVTEQYTESGDAIVLNPGATKSIHITGTVRDYNGVGSNDIPDDSFLNGDLAAIGVSFFRSDVVDPQDKCFPGALMDLNDHNCYFKASLLDQVNDAFIEDMAMEDCEITVATPITATFDCIIPLNYFAEATPLTGDNTSYAEGDQESWVLQMFVADRAGMSGDASPVMASARNLGVEQLVAATMPSGLNYGVIDGGDVRKVSSVETPVTFTITQGGNTAAEVAVDGEDLLCGFWTSDVRTTEIGSVPLANQKWSTNPEHTWASGMTTLTGTAVPTGASLAVATSSTPITDILYFNMQMPASGVGGECRGTTTFTISEPA